MDTGLLKDSPIGRLVQIKGTQARGNRPYDHFAYVPDPLPPEVDIEPATWPALEAAALELGGLKRVCEFLPNPGLLIRPALSREAQSTSALEGTHGTLDGVLGARLPGSTPGTPELREINAYIDMATHGFAWVAENRPISIHCFFELHEILAKGAKRPIANPGALRTDQVIIGPEGCDVEDARFVPPPVDHLGSSMHDFQEWLNSPEIELPAVARVAMAHYQFEALHPFSDGNGRVGRLLALLQLLEAGLVGEPYLSISTWFLKRRSEYQDGLLAVSQTGDWNPWIRFFATAIKEQSRSHVDVATFLVGWQKETHSRLQKKGYSGTIFNIVDQLAEWPVITSRAIQDQYGVSAPGAKHSLDRLVEMGILEELTGKKYNQLFGAGALLDRLESI